MYRVGAGIRVCIAMALALLVVHHAESGTPRFREVTETHLPPPPAGGLASMDAEAIDIDGDGDLDLIVPQEWRSNRLLLNDGRGHFSIAKALFPTPKASELIQPPNVAQTLLKDSEDVSVADFNGDGILDMIMVVEDDIMFGRKDVHQYFRGKPDGTYQRIYDLLPDTEANAVAHADLNGDEAFDLLISGGGQDRLLINDGKGGFTDETYVRLPREASVGQDAEFFDCDGDDDLDLVFGLEGGHALWINDGSGVFHDESRERLPIPGNVEARKVTPADIDGDGDLDLYFAHVSWQGRTPQDRIYLNDGHGFFRDETDQRLGPEDRSTLDAKFADLDQDGDLDLVQGNGGSVRILANDGTGQFRDITAESFGTEQDVSGTSITIELADLNGDGWTDIYVGQISGANDPGSYDRLFLSTAGVIPLAG